jgi:hypothetical protein
VAVGTLHPLAARICCLTWGDRTAFIVVLEVLGVSETLAASITSQLQSIRPGAAAVVAATHTHAAPVGFADEPEEESAREFRRVTVEAVTRAAREASEGATEVLPVPSRVPTRSLAAHRHDPAWPIDASVRALSFVTPGDSELVGAIATFACHPTVLPASNRAYSGDLHGVACVQTEDGLGVPCLLLNGAEGDVSTRFTRRGQEPDELSRLGGILSMAVSSAVRHGQDLHARTGISGIRAGLYVAERSVRLPLRPVPSVGEADTALDDARAELAELPGSAPAGERRRAETRVEGAAIQAEKARRDRPSSEPVKARILGLGIGGAQVVTVPGELFNTALPSMGLDRQDSVMLVGLANGDLGYFPWEGADGATSYEALRSRFGPVATWQIVGGVSDIVSELRSRSERGIGRADTG